MNGNDPLEKRLAAAAPRRVPAEWRSEILAAARGATVVCQTPAAPEMSLIETLKAMFWPHPKAWAGLATAWLVILALNLATRDPVSPEIARQAPPPSPQLRELLREQEQLFAELTGADDKAHAVATRPLPAQPRSERREPFLNA